MSAEIGVATGESRNVATHDGNGHNGNAHGAGHTARYRRSPDVEYRPIGDEGGVLLHLVTSSYHGLNPVGALTWELLAGNDEESGIELKYLLDLLRERLDGAPPTLGEDVREFLDDLVRRDLVHRDLVLEDLPDSRH